MSGHNDPNGGGDITIAVIDQDTQGRLWSSYCELIGRLDDELDPERPPRNGALIRSELATNTTFATTVLAAVNGAGDQPTICCQKARAATRD